MALALVKEDSSLASRQPVLRCLTGDRSSVPATRLREAIARLSPLATEMFF
jgi:hypothetical protein